ncbi:MAG: NUDIX hydrolase, partial [Actinobacteria bacterium]|nr:NUDIX hydrolase [Actinomycetota bacterium]
MQRNWPLESPELAKFRGAHVAIDVALLTIAPGPEGAETLAALAHKRQDGLAAGQWALVGRMLRERERLAEAVQVALREKAGIADVTPRQLFVLDEPTRDSRGWVISVAHIATCKWRDLE